MERCCGRDKLVMAMITTPERRATGLWRQPSITLVTKSALLLLSLATIALASDDKIDRASLRGIKAVCLVVEVTDQGQGAGSGPSQEQLQSEVRDRVRWAGIPLDKDSTTCLYLNVRPLPAMGKNNKPVGLYAIDFKLEFMQAVTLARDPTIRAYASTWSLANLANVPVQDVDRTTREVSIDLVNKFIKAYQSVNK
jgi:hypothetical protein